MIIYVSLPKFEPADTTIIADCLCAALDDYGHRLTRHQLDHLAVTTPRHRTPPPRRTTFTKPAFKIRATASYVRFHRPESALDSASNEAYR
jgi:hypothetical protein